MRIPLREVAHSRAGDKGDISNVSLIAYKRADYEILRREVTAERVKEHFEGITLGEVRRYELPKIVALNFVMQRALAGGVTRSLRMDIHGKALSSLLLTMEIEYPDEVSCGGGDLLAGLIRAEAAVAALLKDGMTVMVGGFGLVGAPLTLIRAMNVSGCKDLTIISNNLGEPGKGLGETLRLGKVRRAIGSYFTSNPEVAAARAEGKIEITLLPQGTFSEAIRAGGAGLGGFYTPTGVGTLLAEGKEVREIGGKTYLLQEPLRADVALIRAHKADTAGNLVYYKTARNFNPMMATAADTVIAEVDEVVGVGLLDPEAVSTPHIYVDSLVLAEVRL